LACRGKSIEINRYRTSDNRVAGLYHSDESRHRSFINLIAAEQFWIVAKISQEPAQLPQSLVRTEDSSRNYSPVPRSRFQNGEAEKIERFLGMPSILRFLDAHQINAGRNILFGR
jgi:hypothetical protein